MQVVGVLNTVSGHLEYCARFRKYLGPHKASPRAAAAVRKGYLLSMGRQGQVLFWKNTAAQAETSIPIRKCSAIYSKAHIGASLSLENTQELS